MSLLQSILSGIVQGITEFIPISSSGHLVLLHHWFGVTEQVSFFLALHVATLFSALVYFYKDILRLFTVERRLGFLILAGCIATFILGIFLHPIVTDAFASVRMAAIGLIIGGAWIIAASLIAHMFFTKRKQDKISVWQAILIGLAQGVSLFPGISRSGASISTALFTGVEKKTAFRYSFLLLIPTTIGALCYEVYTTNFIRSEEAVLVGAGMLSAFVAGLISLKVLFKMISAGKFYVFGIYCIFIGLAAMAR